MKDNIDYTGTCPDHGLEGEPIPPPYEDRIHKILIFTFACPEGHTFTKEIQLK